MAGVRRCRADSTYEYDMTQLLSPSQTKKLKLYTDQVAEKTGCPQDVLHEFVDAGSVFHMLIDLKANSFVRINELEKAALVDLKELIDSKDFKSALQSRLTACLLSPNLTGYVDNTHTNIMEFIKNHREVFKIPAVLINDVELLAQLSKIGMQTIMILTALKAIPLKDLYSPSLIPSLHSDLHIKISKALNCDIDVGTNNTLKEILERTHDHGDNLGEGERTLESGEEREFHENRNEEEEGEEESGQQEPKVDDGGSGFSKRKNGKGPRFTLTKFWNFVDCSLQAIRKAAQEEAGPNFNTSAHGAYENAVRNILVEYFQMDLAKFPGSMVVPKLLTTD
ncbi:hypothetical protein F4604DRAFT_1924990 [Suillus subluteus]|nr:hypothetical protein F4604DRAFT_1924990 [Suillus subluteus]